jgi:hypothetical protein
MKLPHRAPRFDVGGAIDRARWAGGLFVTTVQVLFKKWLSKAT